MGINEYKEQYKPVKATVAIPERFQGNPLEICNQWCNEWTSRVVAGRVRKSPMLAGATGVGKTYQLYAMSNKICEEINKYNMAEWGKIVDYNLPVYKNLHIKFISEVDLFYRMRETTTPQAEWHLLKDIRTVDILMIDDLGTAKLSDKPIETLYNIIDYRLKHCLPTAITTNLTIEEIASPDRYGERIASKLTELCKVIVMTGEDRRVKGTEPGV